MGDTHAVPIVWVAIFIILSFKFVFLIMWLIVRDRRGHLINALQYDWITRVFHTSADANNVWVRTLHLKTGAICDWYLYARAFCSGADVSLSYEPSSTDGTVLNFIKTQLMTGATQGTVIVGNKLYQWVRCVNGPLYDTTAQPKQTN